MKQDVTNAAILKSSSHTARLKGEARRMLEGSQIYGKPVTSQMTHRSGMSEVPSVTPCSAERDFSSGIPTFSRKQSAGSARMALYLSYPDRGGEMSDDMLELPWALDSHFCFPY